MRAELREVNTALRRRRHLPISEQGRWLASVVRGHCAYYAVPDNSHHASPLDETGQRSECRRWPVSTIGIVATRS
jgi:hypothetical protein